MQSLKFVIPRRIGVQFYLILKMIFSPKSQNLWQAHLSYVDLLLAFREFLILIKFEVYERISIKWCIACIPYNISTISACFDKSICCFNLGSKPSRILRFHACFGSKFIIIDSLISRRLNLVHLRFQRQMILLHIFLENDEFTCIKLR